MEQRDFHKAFAFVSITITEEGGGGPDTKVPPDSTVFKRVPFRICNILQIAPHLHLPTLGVTAHRIPSVKEPPQRNSTKRLLLAFH